MDVTKVKCLRNGGNFYVISSGWRQISDRGGWVWRSRNRKLPPGKSGVAAFPVNKTLAFAEASFHLIVCEIMYLYAISYVVTSPDMGASQDSVIEVGVAFCSTPVLANSGRPVMTLTLPTLTHMTG